MPIAPSNLSLVRNPDNPNRITIGWEAVEGDHSKIKIQFANSIDAIVYNEGASEVTLDDSAASGSYEFIFSRYQPVFVRVIAIDAGFVESASVDIDIPAYDSVDTLPPFLIDSAWRDGAWVRIKFQRAAPAYEEIPGYGYAFVWTDNHGVSSAENLLVAWFDQSTVSLGNDWYQISFDHLSLVDDYTFQAQATCNDGSSPLGAAVPLGSAPATSTLTALEALYRQTPGNPPNDEINLTWTFSDPGNPAPFLLEGRVDGGDWFILENALNSAPPYWLTGNIDHPSYQQLGPLNLLGNLFDSDGWKSHLVELRATVDGSEPITASVSNVRLARHPSYPLATWESYQVQGTGPDLGAPRMAYLMPDDVESAAVFIEIDGAPNFLLSWERATTDQLLTQWVSVAPRDGQAHDMRLLVQETRAGGLILEKDTPIVSRVISDEPLPEVPEPVIKGFRWLNVDTVQVDVLPLPSGDYLLSGSVTLDGEPFAASTANVDGGYRFSGLSAVPNDGLVHLFAFSLKTIHIWTELSSAQDAVAYTNKTVNPPRPEKPSLVTASLLRQGDEFAPDHVFLNWASTSLVQIVAVVENRVVVFDYADSTDSAANLQNTRKYLPKDGALHSVSFGVRCYSYGNVSDVLLAPALLIRAFPVPETIIVDPALQLNFSDLVAAVADSAGLTPDKSGIIILDGLRKIKQVVAKGGSVSLDYFGDYLAVWRNGQRIAKFKASEAFTTGVLQGVVIP